jgi:RNA polymerase sigma-70 factor (ECF subfamily)
VADPVQRQLPGLDVVARAIAGERSAQRALYDAYRPDVFRIARSFPGLGADDVDDVVQETFVRAFRHLAKLERHGRVLPWLLTIARNRALTRLSRRQAESAANAEFGREIEVHVESERAPPDPEAELEVDVVRRVIASLPEGPEKDTVQLFYVDGALSASEIAAKLGVGKSAITMRLERFRAKVKKRILAEVARLRGEESDG